MLGLERTVGSCFWIGSDIQIKIIAVRGRRVRIGVRAPDGLTVLREELIAPASVMEPDSAGHQLHIA